MSGTITFDNSEFLLSSDMNSEALEERVKEFIKYTETEVASLDKALAIYLSRGMGYYEYNDR